MKFIFFFMKRFMKRLWKSPFFRFISMIEEVWTKFNFFFNLQHEG